MPSVEKTYRLEDISLDSLYLDCLGIFKNIGATQLRENTFGNDIKEISGTVPSVWGWGKLHIAALVDGSQDGLITFTLRGNIDQWAMSPLTKLMDEFLLQLQTVLKEKYGQTLEYEKLTHFFPKLTKNSPERTQLILFIAILLICGVLPLSILHIIKYILENFKF